MTLSREDRKARQRGYSRAYRARRAAERAQAAAGDSQGVKEPSTEMRDALETALAAMKWLAPSDGALVALARLQAEAIDLFAAADTVAARANAIRFHSALLRSLVELGGTPRMRIQHELRSARLQRATEARAVSTAPNVTKISPRPPKHERT